MEISEQRLREFMAIYEAEFNEKLSLEEARAMASRLVHLYIRLARPLPKEEEIHQEDDTGDVGDMGDVLRG
jgi:hypothetical protein